MKQRKSEGMASGVQTYEQLRAVQSPVLSMAPQDGLPHELMLLKNVCVTLQNGAYCEHVPRLSELHGPGESGRKEGR